MNPIRITPRALVLAISAIVSTTAFATDAATDGRETVELNKVDVKGWTLPDDARPKLNHIMREVDGPLITVTKKTSITKLDNIPTVIDNNLRALFAHTPGLMISEQQTPGQFNLSYRGLGNPQESEYVLVMQDGIPLMADWIGFPTLYYMPMPQAVEQVQLIRGGSSLLYGPEPGPVINYVSRKPVSDRAFAGYTENVFGNNGMFGTFNKVSGTVGEWDYLADVYYRGTDGQRDNADSTIKGTDLHLGYRPEDAGYWALDFHGYRLDAGDAGRLSYPQWQQNPDATPTPTNHNWVDRYTLTLSHERQLGENTMLSAKLWSGYEDLASRSAKTLQDEQFQFSGLDARIVHHWGRGNALTAGAVAYNSNAPMRQWFTTDLLADRYDRGYKYKLRQQRSSEYRAVFAENVFRWGQWHLVPSVRLERESLDVNEPVVFNPPAPAAPSTRKPAHVNVSRNVPLFGIGFGNDFGHLNETYFNVSQGYRPLRYYDVVSPFQSIIPGHEADPSKSLSYEAGVHGTPVPGLFYDASVFWINFKNRIEAQQFTAPDGSRGVIDVNTGDTRHRGAELQVEYDFLAAQDPQSKRHLSLFGNVSLLNARFTDSLLPNQTGNIPAYSPRYLARLGISYREDQKLKLSLSATSVAAQFWQDSNAPGNAASGLIPPKIPQYTVYDLSGDYWVLPQVRLLGGVSNLTDKTYYARVWSNGIEPALGRTYYAGAAYEF